MEFHYLFYIEADTTAEYSVIPPRNKDAATPKEVYSIDDSKFCIENPTGCVYDIAHRKFYNIAISK
jgi:hypothetical protein